jgi:pyruvate, water dikinase
MRRAFHAIGPLGRADRGIPGREEDRLVSVFYGRPSLRVDFMFLMGNRTPGTNAAAIAEQVFTVVPDGLNSRPDRRYYPLVAARFPVALCRAPGLVRRSRLKTARLWSTQVPRIGDTRDCAELRAAFAQARDLFEENIYRAALCLFALVQPVYDLLTGVMERVGDADVNLMAGLGGHEESAMIRDLWSCSRDGLPLETFLARHGYHGPCSGQLSALAWREDPTPVLAILEGYREMSDDGDPALAQQERAAERERLERDLLASLRPARRLQARAVLDLSRRSLPLRAVGKVAFLQSVDLARAAARQLGKCLAEDSQIQDPDDIFFLTVDEVTAGSTEGLPDLIEARRRAYREYQQSDLPNTWQGFPQPHAVARDWDSDEVILDGVGVSPGVVEGRIRVVAEPGETEPEPGEIIVGRTTDPSWASILYLSSALVMDIGGPLSHAAVVARELGIPCVADTKVGTRMLRTGDLCRVNGSTGRVEILQRTPVVATPLPDERIRPT